MAKISLTIEDVKVDGQKTLEIQFHVERMSVGSGEPGYKPKTCGEDLYFGLRKLLTDFGVELPPPGPVEYMEITGEKIVAREPH